MSEPLDYPAIFARVRANAEKACFVAGDLFEIMQVIAMAERAMAGGERMKATFIASGITLPLRNGWDGDIQDATGEPVLQIDPNCERPDDQVAAIGAVVVSAVNTAAGFSA